MPEAASAQRPRQLQQHHHQDEVNGLGLGLSGIPGLDNETEIYSTYDFEQHQQPSYTSQSLQHPYVATPTYRSPASSPFTSPSLYSLPQGSTTNNTVPRTNHINTCALSSLEPIASLPAWDNKFIPTSSHTTPDLRNLAIMSPTASPSFHHFASPMPFVMTTSPMSSPLLDSHISHMPRLRHSQSLPTTPAQQLHKRAATTEETTHDDYWLSPTEDTASSPRSISSSTSAKRSKLSESGSSSTPAVRRQWPTEEDETLAAANAFSVPNDVKSIHWMTQEATDLGRQPVSQVQSVNDNVRKGRFTPDEDAMVVKLVNEWFAKATADGTLSPDTKLERIILTSKMPWAEIANAMPVHRLPAQVRVRYQETLSPSLIRGKWNADEDLALLKGVQRSGLKWIELTKDIPGRTQRQIRTRYYQMMGLGRRRSSKRQQQDIDQQAAAAALASSSLSQQN